MDARIRARITPWELFALAFCASLVVVFASLHTMLGIQPFDFMVYMRTASGNLADFYYAQWILPVFSQLAKLPSTWGYLIWNAINLTAVFYAARTFGGRAGIVLLTFQMLYVLFLGQIVGIIIGALALYWWGLVHRRWVIAGLALAIACTKIQTGFIFGLLFLLLAEISWRDRMKVILIPALIAGLSVALEPTWPLELLSRMQTNPANTWGSISLWRWIGPAALLLWLPPLVVPLPKEERLVAMAATSALALPYFQQADLLTLFVLPIAWPYLLLGNLGFLFFVNYWKALQMLAIVPILVYASILLPALIKRIRSGD